MKLEKFTRGEWDAYGSQVRAGDEVIARATKGADANMMAAAKDLYRRLNLRVQHCACSGAPCQACTGDLEAIDKAVPRRTS